MAHRAFVISFIVVMALCGCGIPGSIKEVTQTLDRGIYQLNNQSSGANDSLKSIVEVLQAVKSDIHDGVIAKQIDNTLGNAILNAQVAVAQDYDFIRRRVIEDLSAIKSAVLGKEPPQKLPFFGNANLQEVDLRRPDITSLVVSGWNLNLVQTGASTRSRAEFLIENKEGQQRQFPSSLINIPGPYKISFNVAPAIFQSENSDNRLIVKWDGEVRFSIAIIPNELRWCKKDERGRYYVKLVSYDYPENRNEERFVGTVYTEVIVLGKNERFYKHIEGSTRNEQKYGIGYIKEGPGRAFSYMVHQRQPRDDDGPDFVVTDEKRIQIYRRIGGKQTKEIYTFYFETLRLRSSEKDLGFDEGTP